MKWLWVPWVLFLIEMGVLAVMLIAVSLEISSFWLNVLTVPGTVIIFVAQYRLMLIAMGKR